VNVQVVNASFAEFLDTYLLAGGIVARLVSVLNDASSASIVGGLVIREILRGGVRSMSSAGVAVIAAAGNSGDTVLSVFGMQYPANAPDSFAVAATDQADRVVPSSMRAIAGQRIALSAPSVMRAANGTETPGTVVANGISAATVCLGSGTSFAAPHVAGAVAALLAPAPPLTRPLGVTDGLTAALRLVATASPIADPASAGGAGVLNLQTAQLPAVVWSHDFQTNFGHINDFAFLPGVSDFALRASGTRLEAIAGPGANISVSVPLPATAAWINALPATSEILLGYSTGIEVRTATGTAPRVVRTTPSIFRAAVSTSSSGGNLIAIGLTSGEVQIVRGTGFAIVATLPPSQSGEMFLDAAWVTRPSPSDELLAARTPSRVEVFRVPVGAALGCSLGAAGCPTRVGSVLLSFSDPSGTSAVNPTDWAGVNEAGVPRILVVDGGSRIFGGGLGGQLSLVTEQVGFAFSEVEASQATVYALDLGAPAVAAITNGRLLFMDAQRFGERDFWAQSPFRIAPSGTYAYVPAQKLVLPPGTSQAIFLGGLVP
jgi:hypothetical protein